ncbi:MAG: hypothetical protein ACREDY_29240 [Bradyrhizobium sp.]
MNALAAGEPESDPQLVWTTVRLNTWVFGVILGLMSGLLLLALALVAGFAAGKYLSLAVTLIGIFVPGYGPGWAGALAGLFWGFLAGGLLGAGVYRITTRSALTRIDELVAFERGDRDFPEAILRLHGPSLGLAIGLMGALGLVGTTSWLVIRGTAAHSVHARLLSEILPGYSVDLPGSLLGAAELFVVLYLVGQVFVFVYNRVANTRQRRA